MRPLEVFLVMAVIALGTPYLIPAPKPVMAVPFLEVVPQATPTVSVTNRPAKVYIPVPVPVVVPRSVAPPPKPKEHPKAARPSGSMCAQIGMGIATIGRAGVLAEARRRGYSAGQIAAAARACGY